MDRFEFKLKTDQMKTYIEQGEAKKAAELADTINWKKIKMVSALCLAGEAYEKADRFEESKELLLMAYDRSPVGRNIIYRLAIVAVKAGKIEEAEEFYEEFVNIAANDNIRFLLKFQIYKGKGASVKELIQILEEYKELESSERWSYELASLYHTAGMAEKCVELCDELVLWYGEGKYVEKALELKLLYQPLNQVQEVTYKQIRQNREGTLEIHSDEMFESGEIVTKSLVIPKVEFSTPSFDTINLQQELQENMKQIMEATERNTVEDHMETIKKLVHQIPYLTEGTEIQSEEEGDKYAHIETNEEIDDSLKIDFKNLLAEDYDGQISLNVPHSSLSEPQINGQMSLEDVLGEWEKTKRAAHTALEVAEQRKLEAAKARALQEASGIMDRLHDVIPQLNAMLDAEIKREHELPVEDRVLSDVLVGDVPVMSIFPQDDYVMEDTHAILREIVEGVLQTDRSLAEEEIKEEIEEKEQLEVDEDLELEEQLETEEPLEIEEDVMDNMDILDHRVDQETKTLDFATSYGFETKTTEQSEDENLGEVHSRFLTSEQKEIFSYFVPVPGMEKQICKAMEEIILKPDNTSATGNIMIIGDRGSGKTQLATNIIRVIQKEANKENAKVGKISAAVLNKKDIIELFSKMAGGYLIIEKIGDLNRETATKLSLAMDQDTNRLIVIIEDTSAGIKELNIQNPEFVKKFSSRIAIPIFTNDELVSFAETYANEFGYEIDQMAILALYNRISNIQKIDRATTLSEVKEIVDGAIVKANKGGIKRKFVGGFGKYKENTEKEILLEMDFER